MKKTILITGASGDIGSEICRFFIKKHSQSLEGFFVKYHEM